MINWKKMFVGSNGIFVNEDIFKLFKDNAMFDMIEIDIN